MLGTAQRSVQGANWRLWINGPLVWSVLGVPSALSIPVITSSASRPSMASLHSAEIDLEARAVVHPIVIAATTNVAAYIAATESTLIDPPLLVLGHDSPVLAPRVRLALHRRSQAIHGEDPASG